MTTDNTGLFWEQKRTRSSPCRTQNVLGALSSADGQTWAGIPSWLSRCCVTLGKSLRFSLPWFPWLLQGCPPGDVVWIREGNRTRTALHTAPETTRGRPVLHVGYRTAAKGGRPGLALRLQTEFNVKVAPPFPPNKKCTGQGQPRRDAGLARREIFTVENMLCVH